MKKLKWIINDKINQYIIDKKKLKYIENNFNYINLQFIDYKTTLIGL